jgi:hypothetical protein
VEVVEGGFVDEVLIFGAFCGVETGDLEGEDVNDTGFEVVLVLEPDARLSCVEECEELSGAAGFVLWGGGVVVILF